MGSVDPSLEGFSTLSPASLSESLTRKGLAKVYFRTFCASRPEKDTAGFDAAHGLDGVDAAHGVDGVDAADAAHRVDGVNPADAVLDLLQ